MKTKNKRQNKKAISLIVLVITIIVMIILASAIILSLNNSGIIGKANEAVSDSNEVVLRQLAELNWAEAYLDETIQTDEQYREYVIGKIEEELDENALSSYYIQVTAKGVSVEKLITVEELQEKHEFKYYSSLSLAVEDVNAGTVGTENSIADRDKSNAKAGAYIDNGNKYVVLLQNYTETKKLLPATDVTINLGGKTLITEGPEANISIDGVSKHTDTIIIDGRLPGSTIISRGVNGGVNSGISGAVLFETRTNNFIIKGGTYVVEPVAQTETCQSLYAMGLWCNKGGTCQIENANITIDLSKIYADTVEDSLFISGVHMQGTECIVNNCEIDINLLNNATYKTSTIGGIQFIKNSGTGMVKNSKINISSSTAAASDANIYIIGLDIEQNYDTTISDCEIIVDSSTTSNIHVYGVLNVGEIDIKRSKIVSNSRSAEVSFGACFRNEALGVATLTQSILEGEPTIIQNEGQLHVDGNLYEE